MESRSRAGKVLLWSCLGREATLVALLNPFFLIKKKKKELEHSNVLRKKQKYERFCAIFLFQYMETQSLKLTHRERRNANYKLLYGERETNNAHHKFSCFIF